MAEARTPPAGGSCPTCGAPVEAGQLVCLTCGGRVALQYKRPPRWQLAVLLAVVIVALAAAGVYFALQAAADEAESEVAEEEGIRAVNALEPAVADRARDARLVVIVGARK